MRFKPDAMRQKFDWPALRALSARKGLATLKRRLSGSKCNLQPLKPHFTVPSWTAPHRRFLLGLDVGTFAVKAVALERGTRGLRLAAAGLEPVVAQDPSDANADEPHRNTVGAIQRLLKRIRIAPSQTAGVATAVGGVNVAVTEFEMPHMSLRELRKAVPWEARKHLADENRVFDYEVIDTQEDGAVRVLMASVPQPQLLELKATLSAAGLEPECIEPLPVVLTRACRRLLRDDEPTSCVILDVGTSGTTIVIGDESSKFFSRFLDIGLGSRRTHVLADGSSSCEIDNVDADEEPALIQEAREERGELIEEFVLEVARSMAFFSTHHGSDDYKRFILAGGGALHEPLATLLTSRLDVPVTRFAYRGNGTVPRIEPPYAVAYGLALRLAR